MGPSGSGKNHVPQRRGLRSIRSTRANTSSAGPTCAVPPTTPSPSSATARSASISPELPAHRGSRRPGQRGRPAALPLDGAQPSASRASSGRSRASASTARSRHFPRRALGRAAAARRHRARAIAGDPRAHPGRRAPRATSTSLMARQNRGAARAGPRPGDDRRDGHARSLARAARADRTIHVLDGRSSIRDRAAGSCPRGRGGAGMMASSLRLRLRTLRRHAGASAIMAAAIGVGIARVHDVPRDARAARRGSPRPQDRALPRRAGHPGGAHRSPRSPEVRAHRALVPHPPHVPRPPRALPHRGRDRARGRDGVARRRAGPGRRADRGEPARPHERRLLGARVALSPRGAWGREADARAERVCVISEAANDALFGGGDSARAAPRAARRGLHRGRRDRARPDEARRPGGGWPRRRDAVRGRAMALHVWPAILLPPGRSRP